MATYAKPENALKVSHPQTDATEHEADVQRAEELISIGNKEQAYEHLVDVISQYVHHDASFPGTVTDDTESDSGIPPSRFWNPLFSSSWTFAFRITTKETPDRHFCSTRLLLKTPPFPQSKRS